MTLTNRAGSVKMSGTNKNKSHPLAGVLQSPIIKANSCFSGAAGISYYAVNDRGE